MLLLRFFVNLSFNAQGMRDDDKFVVVFLRRRSEEMGVAGDEGRSGRGGRKRKRGVDGHISIWDAVSTGRFSMGDKSKPS